MTFDQAFAKMREGKWVKCAPQATLYSIQEGVFIIKIQDYNAAGKQHYYIAKTLAPSDPSTLFVKHLLSDQWEVVA